MPRTSVRGGQREVQAVTTVSFEVNRGETLGIVGESGSGKSTLARLLLALDRPTSGEILFEGKSIVGLPEKKLRHLRRQVQIVFQDPMGSLDPRMRVGKIILEPIRSLGIEGDEKARLKELVASVGLDADSVNRYPHEFSGGQRQRIAIARALAPRPRVLIADEPASALDVSVQAQILNLLDDLKARFDFTMMMISHDLSVIHHMCERVLVMHRGEIVEIGPTRQVFETPQHPYTKALLASVPTLDGDLPEAPPETLVEAT
ncbi:MAG: ATP-binding cassette domain-containing protein [Actinobacteria bacterium]|nr:ATP-binding cassette domain-containing protein [Actinomycetota bacterium]